MSKKEGRMTNLDEASKRKLNGCAWALIVIAAPVVLAIVFVLLRILWMFGSWLGQL